MKLFRKDKKGQTAIEYAVLLIIIMGSFIGIQNYVKRGMQGRWKSAVDELGDQYDPRTAFTKVTQNIYSNTNTTIVALNTAGGYWTRRIDDTISQEQKTGYESSGAY
jgi:Flp pilus assembly pilin Flp